MSKILKVAGIVALAVGILAAGFVAGSQVARGQAAAPDVPAFGQGGNGLRGFEQGRASGDGVRRRGQNGGGPGGVVIAAYRDQLDAALARALGMTTDEFDKAVQAGQTPWQIAQAKGMNADQFQAAILQAHTEVLAQAVEDGKLTQDQADAMLEHLKQHIDQGFGPGDGTGNEPQP